MNNKKNIKFSIIIPCYDTGDYLDVCFQSLINQTIGIECLEFIVIDDASDDDKTIEKLKEYERKYPDNIILIINEENKGPGGCKNIAIKYATGEYVAYVDSDDWIDKCALERLYDLAKMYNADVVEFGNSITSVHDGNETHIFNNTEKPSLYLIDNEEKRKEFILPSDSTVICTDKIYSTKLIRDNNIVFAEKISYEEPPFSYMVRFFSERYLKVSDKYYYYFNRPGSMSDIERYKKNRFNIIDGYLVLLNQIIDKNLIYKYREESEFIFWCGAFYLPLFNIASANGFYTKEEYDYLQKTVSSKINNICENKYFKQIFEGLEIIGKITNLPVDDNTYEDVKELFIKITGR